MPGLSDAKPVWAPRLVLFRLAKRMLDRQRASWPNIPGLGRLLWIFYRVVKPEGFRWIKVRGMHLYVDGTDEIIYPALVAYGSHDPEEHDLIESLVQPGMTVLDVGANIGIYTVTCANLVGPEGRVYAFEPEPGTFALLRANLETNGVKIATVYQNALSDEEGVATLFLDRWNAGGHTLLEGNVTTQEGGTTLIEMLTLDGVFAEERVVADFVKMDAQGFEGHVVRGGREFLTRGRTTLLMEFWPEGLRNAGTEPEDLLRELADLGYRVVAPEQAVVVADDPAAIAEEAAGPTGNGFLNLLLERSDEP